MHFGAWVWGLYHTSLPHSLLCVTSSPVLLALGCLILRKPISSGAALLCLHPGAYAGMLPPGGVVRPQKSEKTGVWVCIKPFSLFSCRTISMICLALSPRLLVAQIHLFRCVSSVLASLVFMLACFRQGGAASLACAFGVSNSNRSTQECPEP